MVRRKFVLLSFLLSAILVHAINAQVPRHINFQARIDSLTETSASVAFAIFDQLEDGTELWSESYPSLPVNNRTINVLLGEIEPFLPSVFESDGDRYLEITVNGARLKPRSQLSSVAYALRASRADTAYALVSSNPIEVEGDIAIRSGNTLKLWRPDNTNSANIKVISTADGQVLQFILEGNNGTLNITQRENVGIGTISPISPLHVKARDVGWKDHVTLQGMDDEIGWRFLVDSGLPETAKNAFRFRYDSGQAEQSINVLTNGNFGIGVTPSEKLDVNGKLRVRGEAIHLGTNDGRDAGQNTDQVALAHGDLDDLLINHAGSFEGGVEIGSDLRILGKIEKASGSFKIDHPLDPTNKYLSHSFVESPDMMNLYNGNVTLDKNGEAWIDLPPWFEALNMDFRYQLTCIGGFAQVYIDEEISDNRFKIAGGLPNLKVSWMVTGIRQDPYAKANRIQVEEDKPVHLKGTYLHPKAYTVPEPDGL